MLLEVVNPHGRTILKITNIEDMLSDREINEIASLGYRFVLDGQTVDKADVTAYYRKQITAQNGR